MPVRKPYVHVHRPFGPYKDCVVGKKYPAKQYNRGEFDAEGYETRAKRTLGFFDEAGGFVNQAVSSESATLVWEESDV